MPVKQPYRETIEITTNAGGDGGPSYSQPLKGKILDVIYTADGTTPYDNTVDFTITLESSLQNVWTQSNLAAAATKSPRKPVHDQGGTAITNGWDYIFAFNERLKIVVAQGGNTKKGKFTVICESLGSD